MALSDLAVFSEFVYEGMTEVVDQQVALFNEASQGTIILRSNPIVGDFSDKAHWKNLAGLVRRRNAYGSGAVASIDLEHLVDTMVKVAAGTPPVNMPPGQFNWIQRNPEEGGAVVGQQLAEAAIQDMLNTSIMAYVAALTGEADVNADLSGSATNFGSLLTGAALFGDRSNDLQAWCVHSTTMFTIFGTALANTDGLFTFGTVNVRQDGFGRPFIVTDSPSLINVTPDPDTYYALGLVPGGIVCEQNDDFTDNLETSNGDENIQRSYQAEWSYNLGIKGYSWDKTNGGASPNDASLATADNWDRYSSSHKDTAGVLLELAA